MAGPDPEGRTQADLQNVQEEGGSKVFANEKEAQLERGLVLSYQDMTVAGLVRAVLDETDQGRLLAVSYRTSLNHIDRLLGLKKISTLSAKLDFAQNGAVDARAGLHLWRRPAGSMG